MRVELNKNFDKGVFYTIKTAIGYHQNRLGTKLVTQVFVNCHKLQKIDNFGQVLPPFDIKLSNTSVRIIFSHRKDRRIFNNIK